MTRQKEEFCHRGHPMTISNNGRNRCVECARVRTAKRDQSTESIKASKRKWTKENPNYYREWKSNPLNREKKRISNRRWVDNNPAKNAQARRQWEKSNPEYRKAKDSRRRALKAGNGGFFTAQEWKDLCKKYNYKCLCCKKRKKLTADHVITVSKGGTSNIDNIQPLCGICNSSKGAKIIDYR